MEFTSDSTEGRAYTRCTYQVFLAAATVAKWQASHQQDRVTAASAQAAVQASTPGSSSQVCPYSQASACFKPRASCPKIAFGDFHAVFIFHSLWNCPATFKGGVTTLKNRPFPGASESGSGVCFASPLRELSS